MEQIKTATGKALQSDYIAVIPSPKQAYIRIIGSSLTQVAEIFSNPAETVQLWHGETYLAGYTRLVAIIPEAGAIKVALEKE